MAVHHNDRLAKILGDSKHSNRRDIWLWFSLNNYGCNLGPLESSGPGIRDKMANFLNGNQWLTDKIKQDQTIQLLPDESFKWFNEGNRQIEWLKSKVAEASGYQWLNSPSNLHGMDLLLSIIDRWPTDITHKQLVLNDIKARWETHKKGDKVFRWFRDNDQKSVLAWEWLSKNSSILVDYQRPFETIEDLLIFFDNSYYTPEQRDLYIEKIKKRWGQQKYRENLKGKSQYNFVLSDKAADNLEKLASRYEISRARLLELLIEMETEKNDHIPERIRTLKLLTTP